MKVIILGADSVGFGIAKYISSENNEVTIIDNNQTALKEIGSILDVRPIVGHAASPDILKKAGAENADLIVSVTGSDEVNIVACQIAKDVFNIKTKIARLYNKSYIEIPSAINRFIDVIIFPETEIAKSLRRNTRIAGAFDAISISSSKSLKIIGIKCPLKSILLNTPLRLLNSAMPKSDIVVISIKRNGITFFPCKDDILMPGDDIYFIAKTTDIQTIMETFDAAINNNRKILIIGGGRVGISFAKEVESWNDGDYVLIENNLAKAEDAACILQGGEILQGDALEVLSEMDLNNFDTVVSVTNDDKINMLSALLAKRQGANRAVALLNQAKYADFITSLGIDGIIDPQSITVATILQNIRKISICSLNILGDGQTEIIEIIVKPMSSIIGIMANEINVENKVMVAILIRNNEIIYLPKNIIISSEDILIIVIKKELISKIESIFAPMK